jgi:hypothetical protein
LSLQVWFPAQFATHEFSWVMHSAQPVASTRGLARAAETRITAKARLNLLRITPPPEVYGPPPGAPWLNAGAGYSQMLQLLQRQVTQACVQANLQL